tara:strand:- start:309 stop:974 length:666 start_codon:yes stop_codon:yes gene_type:complete
MHFLMKYSIAAISVVVALLTTVSSESAEDQKEVVKTISLLGLNPMQLQGLKKTGKCTFELTERLFDLDFPGHYDRKIRSISISIPAMVGPYQNLQASLRQTSHSRLLKPDLQGVDFLLDKTEVNPGDQVLRSSSTPSQSVAISRGVNDSGIFELDFGDERHIPFEGTGAVSNWEFEIRPESLKNIDTDSISDLIINLNYSALEDDALKLYVQKKLGDASGK